MQVELGLQVKAAHKIYSNETIASRVLLGDFRVKKLLFAWTMLSASRALRLPAWILTLSHILIPFMPSCSDCYHIIAAVTQAHHANAKGYSSVRRALSFTTWKEYTKETIVHAPRQGRWKIKLQIKGKSYNCTKPTHPNTCTKLAKRNYSPCSASRVAG